MSDGHVLSLRAAEAAKATEGNTAVFDLAAISSDSRSSKPIDLLRLMVGCYTSIVEFYNNPSHVTMMAKMGKELKAKLYAAATVAKATKVKLADGIEIRMQFPDSNSSYPNDLTWSRFCAISAIYLNFLGSKNQSVNENLPTALGSSLRLADEAEEAFENRFYNHGWFALPGTGYLASTIMKLKGTKKGAMNEMAKFYDNEDSAGIAFLYCMGLSFTAHQRKHGQVHDDASEYATFVKENPGCDSAGPVVAAYRQNSGLSVALPVASRALIKDKLQLLIFVESKESLKRVSDGLEALLM